MHGPGLLSELVLTYGLALAFLVVGSRFRVPGIVAFMLAGIVAGPAGIGIVGSPEQVDLLAEIGIVLLLFMVGLEVSPREVGGMWRMMLVGGGLQVGLTTAAVAALAVLGIGFGWQLGLLLGLFVALSSTAIVLKELASRNELSTPHGRLTIAVLLFQDLVAVLVLALEPVLAGQLPASAVPLVLLKTLVALMVVAAVGWVVLPWVLRLAARVRSREAFTLATLVVSIGTAWAASQLGTSMAIGAFLAGFVLAESEFSAQIHAELRPQRDLLASLFFISVGMLIDPRAIGASFGWVVATAVGAIALTAVPAVAAFLAAAAPLRVAVTSAVGLSQVGEFSFLVGRAGVESGLVPPHLGQVLLGAGVLTMAATPFLVAVAPGVGAWMARRLVRAPGEAPGFQGHETPAGHVVIVGFGLGGRLLARTLKEIGQPYEVIELNAATVEEARAKGEPVSYGDASHPDSSSMAGIASASALVIMVSDLDASLRLVREARQRAPRLPIIVRAKYRGEVERLERAGATLAVAEELEASLEVLSQLLARLDVPGNVIDVLLGSLRHHVPGARPLKAPSVPLADTAGLGDLPMESHVMVSGDWATGRSLADVNLRANTQASVVAIRRGTQWLAPPPASTPLEAGDVLYLLGDPSDLLLARNCLTRGGSGSGP